MSKYCQGSFYGLSACWLCFPSLFSYFLTFLAFFNVSDYSRTISGCLVLCLVSAAWTISGGGGRCRVRGGDLAIKGDCPSAKSCTVLKSGGLAGLLPGGPASPGSPGQGVRWAPSVAPGAVNFVSLLISQPRRASLRLSCFRRSHGLAGPVRTSHGGGLSGFVTSAAAVQGGRARWRCRCRCSRRLSLFSRLFSLSKPKTRP